MYAGFWTNNEPIKAKIYFKSTDESSLFYDGQLKNYMYHGRGKLYAKQQVVYLGDFENG